ncbi:MAG: transglycosylase domain-containing protein [Acidimicrobiales bacterium]
MGLLSLTALAGAAWLLTHIPLPPEVPQAQTSIVYDGGGNQLALLHGDQNRFPVKLDQVPQVLQHAVVAAEDRKFFKHRGIDPIGILRATWADLRHKGVRQGGSTITQQYVKNAFVGGSSQRTLIRKLKEAVIAVKIEHKYTKQQILERYLNTVYFGRGAYGVEAAAKAYFDKDVSQLGLPESSYLAGIIRTPSDGEVYKDPVLARNLRTIVLNAMVVSQSATRAEADAVESVDIKTYTKPPRQSDTTVTATGIKGVDYFVEYVRQQLLKSYSLDEVLRGGLRIYTSLDPSLQNLAYDAVYTDTLNRKGDPAGALVSVDGDGRVVAMVGGRDFQSDAPGAKVNLAVGADGGGTGRQAGSTFKPFVLAETVKEGYSVESSFNGPPKIVLPKADNGNDWQVSNYDDASFGRINLIDATVNSVNTVYAQLISALGPDGPKNVAATARSMGVKSPLNPVVSITLGTNNVSVLDMADAYLTFANEGNQTDPRVIRKLMVGGTVLVDDRPKRTRVLDKNQADTVNFILRQVVDRGSGMRARLPNGPAWGKTGTTDNYGDAWFVGFNRKLTTAVWMGYPQGQSEQLLDVHGQAKVNGGSIPADIWRKFMSRAAPDTGEYAVPTSFDGRPLSAIVPYAEPTSSTVAPLVTTPATAPPATAAGVTPTTTTAAARPATTVTPTTSRRAPSTTAATIPCASLPPGVTIPNMCPPTASPP